MATISAYATCLATLEFGSRRLRLQQHCNTIHSDNGISFCVFSVLDSTAYAVIPTDCKACCKESKNDNSGKDTDRTSLLCALKPRKRKERRESCCQERKLIRSNSEERILEDPTNAADSIRRVSSHEDFNSEKHIHTVSQIGQDMGHGVVGRCIDSFSWRAFQKTGKISSHLKSS